MIELKLRNGRVIQLTADTTLVIDGQEVDPTNIELIEFEEAEVGGSTQANELGSWRVLGFRDPLTGIRLQAAMPIATAREVGGYLMSGGGVEVATHLPAKPE